MAMHVMPAKGLQHEKCGDIRPFFYVLMDILSRISSVRDVSWVCYAYMWFYDLRKVEHWIALCSLVQRPNRDQGVNHPEPRQVTLLVRWVWIYLCFEIDQWLEYYDVPWNTMFSVLVNILQLQCKCPLFSMDSFTNHGVLATQFFFWVCHTLGVQ